MKEISNSSAVRLIACYVMMFLNLIIALYAFLCLRDMILAALVRFEVYMFAHRAIDIFTVLTAMLLIIVLFGITMHSFENAAHSKRLIFVFLKFAQAEIAIIVLFRLATLWLVSASPRGYIMPFVYVLIAAAIFVIRLFMGKALIKIAP